MLADPADGPKVGWISIWTRWVLHASVFVKLRRAEYMCSRGEPLETRGLLWDAQGDVMAARVVGIRQERIKSLPDGAVQEGRGTRSVNSCHDVTRRCAAVNCRAGAQVANCRAGGAHKKKEKKKQASPLRVNRIPRQGVEDPLAWAQDTTS